MENFTTSKVIGEGIIQIQSHDGCITTLQGVRHVHESMYNLISLGTLHGEGFSFSPENNLIEVFKDVHACEVSGQTCWRCLHVAKFGVYSWWIAVIAA